MPRRAKFAPAVAIACAGLLLVTVLAVRWSDAVRRADRRLFDALSVADGDGSPARLVAGIADPLPFVVLGALLVGITLAHGERRRALAMAVVLALAAVTTEGLKHLLAQGTLHAGAFPSGHTTAAVGLAVCLVLAVPGPRRGAAFATSAVVAAAVGMAVVVIGWHTPTDVVGGVLVAGLVAAAVVSGSGRGRARSRRSARRG